jgi:hypothetical protein
MRSKLLLNLVLIVVVAALAVYAILKPEKKPETGPAVTALKREAVSSILIEPRGGAAIRLERSGSGWQLAAPITGRADASQVDPVFDILSAHARQKLPYADLARFDLEQPMVRLTLGSEAFAFGKVNEITNEQYVATKDAIYLLAPFYGYGIPTDALKLVSRKLLAEDETPVAVDFGRHRATRAEDGKWSYTAPPPAGKGELSQDEFNRWADEWRVTYALSVEPYKGSGGRPLTVHFKGGKSVAMRVIESGNGVGLVRTDQGLLYRFGPDAGRRLLDPYATTTK